MNARVTDRQVLLAIGPGEVAAYLRSSAWTLKGYYKDSASVWQRDKEQLLLPTDDSFADYARRVAEILETLSEVEKRSQLEIVRDLATATSDVVRVRVSSQLSSNGSLGLEEGLALVEGAKDIMLSAARAAVAPRAYFRSRLPGAADEYMRKVRLGQTEQGSYVVTLVCPVSPELHSTTAFHSASVEEPFDRRVTRTLATALRKSVAAAHEARLRPDMTPFISAVRDGVSANLCNALAEMGSKVGEGRIEIAFAWSRSRSNPDVSGSPIIISHDDFPVMREAARVLKETFWDDDFELWGPVVRMESGNPTLGGEVIAYGEIEDSWRKVLLHLGPIDYEAAVEAHTHGLPIFCRGRLVKEGRYFTMRDVRGFGVEEEAV